MQQVTRNVVEAECRMYWRLARDLHAAAAYGRELYEIIDELDVLREMSDSQPMKDRCMTLMMKYAGRANAQRPVKRAGA